MFLAGLTPLGAVCLAVALFSGSLVPFFLLVDADFTAVSRWLRTHATDALDVSRDACRNVAALVLLLTTSPKGAMAA